MATERSNEKVPDEEELSPRQYIFNVGEDLDSYTQHFVPTYKNNNQHVVPVGVIIVLFTLYIAATALQQNCKVTLDKQAVTVLHDIKGGGGDTQNDTTVIEEIEKNLNHNEILDSLDSFDSLGSLPENKDVCNDIDIFGQKIKLAIGGNGSTKKLQTHNIIRNGHKKTQKLIKVSKSSKSKSKMKFKKSFRNETKQQNKQKTAVEPIIYLFVFVFIYLLLKAVSDINQHYKSQPKGDKSLIRRCSLQSYAQAHKQDRRASKAVAPKYLPKL